jgi:hypothetical protein
VCSTITLITLSMMTNYTGKEIESESGVQPQ